MSLNLAEIFAEEVEVNLKEATRLTLEFEQSGNDAERPLIEALMRAFHTLKGAARAIQFDAIKDAAHTIEDLYHDLLDGKIAYDSAMIDTTLAAIDDIRAMATAGPEASDTAPKDNDVADTSLSQSADVSDETPPQAAPAISLPAGLNIMAIFAAEAETHLSEAQRLLDAWATDGLDEQRAIDLRRVFHTLKGASRAVQLTDVVEASFHLESLYHDLDLESADAALREETLAGLAALRSMLRGDTGDTGSAGQNAEPSNKAAAEPEPPSSAAEKKKTPEQTSKPVKQRAGKSNANRSTAITFDTLDSLHNLSGELTVAVGALGGQRDRERSIASELSGMGQAISRALSSALLLDSTEGNLVSEALRPLESNLHRLNDAFDSLSNAREQVDGRLGYLADAIGDEVTRARLVPLDELFGDYPRLTRDLGKELGKKLKIQIKGGTSRIDKAVLEQIRTPLLHLFRNAIDHGIENAETRKKNGKTLAGNLTIEAVRLGAGYRIMLEDDGKGIDLTRVRDRVIKKGMTTRPLWDAMTTDEQMQFLFLPGFTTARKVSSTSGRGFGLDIVKTTIEAIGGRVEVESKKGLFSRFVLHVPQTLALARCILVLGGRHPLFGDQLYAFPIAEIESVKRLVRHDLRTIDGRPAIRVNDETLFLHELHHLLGLAPAHNEVERMHLMILNHGEERHGLLVQEVLDELDMVSRPPDMRLGKIQEIEAVSLLTDGRVAMIIDVHDLLQRMSDASYHLESTQPAAITYEQDAEPPKHILVVEDSVTVREVERHFLEEAGYEVTTAVNGVDGLNKAKSSDFHMIISDIDMPRMNGIDMISSIRELERFQETPIIVVSYKDRDEDRTKALQAGANRYVTKSEFDTGDMLDIISNLLA